MAKKIEDEQYEAKQRQERMETLEARIARTSDGERFLDRMYEIKQTQPLHPPQGE